TDMPCTPGGDGQRPHEEDNDSVGEGEREAEGLGTPRATQYRPGAASNTEVDPEYLDRHPSIDGTCRARIVNIIYIIYE
ncbi:hypothetical protein KIPB_016408, partial [Kipferlia bialata]